MDAHCPNAAWYLIMVRTYRTYGTGGLPAGRSGPILHGRRPRTRVGGGRGHGRAPRRPGAGVCHRAKLNMIFKLRMRRYPACCCIAACILSELPIVEALLQAVPSHPDATYRYTTFDVHRVYFNDRSIAAFTTVGARKSCASPPLPVIRSQVSRSCQHFSRPEWQRLRHIT